MNLERKIRGRYFVVDADTVKKNVEITLVNGRIVEILEHSDIPSDAYTVIFPGFVNAHTHIQFSLYRSTLKERDCNFYTWIKEVISFYHSVDKSFWKYSYLYGLDLIRRSEAALVFDVVSQHSLPDLRNTLDGVYDDLLVDYLEVAGVNAEEWDSREAKLYYTSLVNYTRRGKRIGISPHSVYTVSKKIYSSLVEMAKTFHLPIQTHLSETLDEVEYCTTGTGKFSDIFKYGMSNMGMYPEDFLLTLVDRCHDRYLYNTAAHCVHVDSEHFKSLIKNQIIPVICSRSNRYLKAGTPDVVFLMENKIPFLIGTDSLASSPSLNIVEEAYELIRSIDGKYKDNVDKIYRDVFMAMTFNLFKGKGGCGESSIEHRDDIARLMFYDINTSDSEEEVNSASPLIKLLLSRQLTHVNTLVGNTMLL